MQKLFSFLPFSCHLAICMMESLFHSEKLFQVHILCQREVKGGNEGEWNEEKINNKQHYLFKL